MAKKGLRLLSAVMTVVITAAGSTVMGGAFFFFLSVIGDDRADKEEIIAFVCEHEEELLYAVESSDYSAFENKGFIQDISDEDTVVDFYCGGSGFGSATSYVGFYYTPDHNMLAMWCAPTESSPLVPSGNGYAWNQPDGDNWYYTEHICGNFYYYEAGF